MSDVTPEQWRPVPGFEDAYEVSDFGRVRTLAHVVRACDGRTHPVPARMRKLSLNANGYLRLILKRNGEAQNHRVHILVCRAFHGERPSGKHGECVRHLNGDRQDNRAENLAYGSHEDNTQDRIRHESEAAGESYEGLSSQQLSAMRLVDHRVDECVNGHLYTSENSRFSRRGKYVIRECKTCRSEQLRRWRVRQKQLNKAQR